MKVKRLIGFCLDQGYSYTNKITNYQTFIYRENWNITLNIHQRIVFTVRLFHRPIANETFKN